MKTNKSPGRILKKILLAVVVLLFSDAWLNATNPVLKVFEDWNTTNSTQNSFQKSVVRSRAFGGVTYYYLTGATLNSSGQYEILIQKMSATGTQLWSRTYSGTGAGNSAALDIQIDAVGNVYVCGTTYKNSTDSCNAVIVKYNSAGSYKWAYPYNGPGSRNDGFSALAVNGNSIFAVGSAWGGSTTKYDFVAVKVDSSGNGVWQNTWNYATANLNDGATNLYSSGGSLWVAGGVQSATTTYKYGLLKMSPSTGVISSTSVTGGTAFGIDKLTDIQTDVAGNIYVTGGVLNVTTLYDFKTIKFDTALNIVWSANYDGGSNLDDVGTGLYLDPSGNVIVTGYSNTTTQGKNFKTVKYNSSGSQLWASSFNGTANKNDSATSIVVGDTDHIYISGYSNNGSTKDYWTVRYNSAGTQIWDIGYNGIANGDDIVTAMALDTNKNVIVTGQNQKGATRTYTTVRYVEKNTTLPQDTISTTSSSFVFTENRGQLLMDDSTAVPQIRYYTLHSKPEVYFSDTAVSYVFIDADTSTQLADSVARVDMKFVGANSDLRVRAMDARDEYFNFYYPHIPGGREHVSNYSKLVSYNVWNNVDVIYGSDQTGLKTYFICKPSGGGTSAGSIYLKFAGADSLSIGVNGELKIYTPFGTIVQPKAAAWQIDNSGNFSALGWQPDYSLSVGNVVKFTNFGSYTSSNSIVIAFNWQPPTLQVFQNLYWSTYFGGNYRDEFDDVDVRKTTGEVFLTGWSASVGFPHNPTAYQTTNSGGFDAVATKLNSNNAIVYSTYYGSGPVVSSNAGQWGQAGAVDNSGNFIIGGRTAKVGNVNIAFPSSQPAGAYVDTTYAGGTYDAFFAGFNPFGALIWATYYGGNDGTQEMVNDLAFDPSGNLYAVMGADTSTPRMIQSGAFNDSTDRGGMILKFAPNLALQWATMYGSKNGTVDRIAIAPNGNVFISGTAKDSIPLVNSGGYYDDTLNGASDAFISEFKGSPNQLIWSTYLGGSSSEAGGGMVVTGNSVYFIGATGSSNFPQYYPGGGAFMDSTYNGGTDAFIARFNNSTNQKQWFTIYGDAGYDAGSRIDADSVGNVYLGGYTTSNLPIYCGLQPIYQYCMGTGLAGDGFILCFTKQNWMRWSTGFMGTNQDNPAIGVTVDQTRKRLYICGNTATPYNPPLTSYPIQNLAGAYNQGNLASGALVNACIARFALDSFVVAGISENELHQNSAEAISVFPNPSEGEFIVNVNSDGKNRKIEVYNSIGQIIQTLRIPDGNKTASIFLNLGNEATGLYFVVLSDESGLHSTKIIKQ